MNPLISILRAAHCRSTHHFFAIDALPMVQTDAGRRLVQVLLRHHDRYLTGAKDPDTRFRDFQNHVVHVTDGYWGGAPRVAHAWYDRMQRYLRTNRPGDAAHAAGVLSHYFTDPMMPLHTQQCEREKVLHRPIEWSVTKSYDAILKTWRDDQMRIVFDLSDRVGWLGEAILHGARYANRSYFPLLDTYDLERGRVDPPAGLNLVARRSLAELFGLAITGWARVLERAAGDAEAATGKPIASASLTVGAALASIRVPMRWWIRRIEHRREQECVTRLIREFQRSGTLQENLPAEVDIVHRVVAVHRHEMSWQQQRRRAQLASQSTVVEVQTPAPQAEDRPATAEVSAGAAPEIQAVSQSDSETGSPSSAADDRPATIPFTRPVTANPFATPAHPMPRCRLSRPSPLVDAPSIGPKTAQRFASIDVETVGQFLDQSAAQMAESLLTYWITTDTVTQWQWQAKLMCEIPGLLARDCQLLAGSQYNSAATVAVCDPHALHQEVSAFAATASGRRCLRGAEPPPLADVQQWIDNAARATQAAMAPSAMRRAA
ncbi:hypothetical protein K227x_63410 [Rubripirellula lacrimiformis]|uniref:DUF4332 domain-containing protein n=2 Tax=Rubripirellula lacrimiformis TaxID=1930273 RepID=A0A517NLA6_9BACT|nr:hypothetical protein K227x_63410 [Rubripirellula lacrimiformis]